MTRTFEREGESVKLRLVHMTSVVFDVHYSSYVLGNYN